MFLRTTGKQNSNRSLWSGRVSPTPRRVTPSLRSGGVIDSTLRCASKAGASHPLYMGYIYGLLPEGSVRSAGGFLFKSPVVIEMFEMFAEAIT